MFTNVEKSLLTVTFHPYKNFELNMIKEFTPIVRWNFKIKSAVTQPNAASCLVKLRIFHIRVRWNLFFSSFVHPFVRKFKFWSGLSAWIEKYHQPMIKEWHRKSTIYIAFERPMIRYRCKPTYDVRCKPKMFDVN